MRGFISFIVAAFARSIGHAVTGAILLGAGVNPQKIASWFVDSPPPFLAEWWFPYVLVGPAILFIACVFYKQSIYERARPLPFNVPMKDVVDYVRSMPTWGVNENPGHRIKDMSIFVAINQKVRDGTIELHGRREIDPSRTAFDGRWMLTWEPITRKFPDYWDAMQVSVMVMAHGSTPEAETEPISATNNTLYPRFTQLRAAWPQIPIVWPKANIFMRTLKRIRLWREK